MEKKTKSQVEKKTSSSSSGKTKAHKPVNARGRIFKGFVVSKHSKRVAIEFDRTVYLSKYESFMKKKTKIHARLPDEMANSINVGDLILVQECRPLSKIIHSIVIKKVEDAK